MLPTAKLLIQYFLMPTITCKLPKRLDAQVKALAREDGVTKSQFVRDALETKVSRRCKRKPAVSAYDLVKDLAGSVRVPADILTNPKYMEGFGE